MTLQPIIWVCAAVVVFFATRTVLRLALKYVTLRTDELRAAVINLDDYESHIDEVLSDPALPQPLRNLLCDFDEVVGHRPLASRMALLLFTRSGLHDQQSLSEEYAASDDEIGFLAKHRPDLRKAYMRLIARGFAYSMLKWQFSARLLRLMQVNTTRDAITPANTLISFADRDHHHHHGFAQVA